ncbi:MAG: hypothetical protein FJ358_06515 [Thaumarchaeota archaeon]|nr:hypothetical protein [Nitrososphaerota archaeon]
MQLDNPGTHPDDICHVVDRRTALLRGLLVGGPSGKYAEKEISFRKILDGLHDPVLEDDLVMFLNIGGLVSPGVDPRCLPLWPLWNSLKNGLK